MKTAAENFSSLDRQFSCDARYVKPDRYRALLALERGRFYIPQGAGISYSAASFGPKTCSVNMRAFDRLLAFDAGTGTVEVEAGISLGKLYDFLSPKGFYLSAQPGHPQITVGGCIAFNVHGKNQFREGLFDSLVDELVLFHPAKGLLRLSRRENTDLFELTCGGFGLTGIIVSARLKAQPMPTRAIRAENVPTRSLRHTFEEVERLKDSCDMLYSWNDLSRPGSSAGKGFVTCGRFTLDGAVPPSDNSASKIRCGGASRSVAVLNGLSIPLLNAAYYLLNTTIHRERTVPFYQFTYPVADKAFYFDLFGRAGFVERQMLIPQGRQWDYLERAERLIARHKPRIALATVKIFRGRPRLLNYDGAGISFSLDLVGCSDNMFHRELDDLNMEYGVLDNPAKDSRLTAQVAAAEYPGYRDFRRRLWAFDPARDFRSELSERLGL